MDVMNYGLKNTPTPVIAQQSERYASWMNNAPPMAMQLTHPTVMTQGNCHLDNSNASMTSSNMLFARSHVNDKLRSKLLERQSVVVSTDQFVRGNGPAPFIAPQPPPPPPPCMVTSETPCLPGGKSRTFKSERGPKPNLDFSEFAESNGTHCPPYSSASLPCRPLPTLAPPSYYGGPPSSYAGRQESIINHTAANNCRTATPATNATATITCPTVKLKQETNSTENTYQCSNHYRPHHKGFFNNAINAPPTTISSPHHENKTSFCATLPPFDSFRECGISSLPLPPTRTTFRSDNSTPTRFYPSGGDFRHLVPRTRPETSSSTNSLCRSRGDFLTAPSTAREISNNMPMATHYSTDTSRNNNNNHQNHHHHPVQTHKITTPLPIHPQQLPPFSARFNTAFNKMAFNATAGAPVTPEVSVIRRTNHPTAMQQLASVSDQDWKSSTSVEDRESFVHKVHHRTPSATFQDRLKLPNYLGTNNNSVNDFSPPPLNFKDFTSRVPPWYDGQASSLFFDQKPIMDFASMFSESSSKEYQLDNNRVLLPGAARIDVVLSAESMKLTEEANRLDRLQRNAKQSVPPCACANIEHDFPKRPPFYTSLGTAASLAEIRDMMELRTGTKGEAIRIEKLRFTGKEGKTTEGCPIAKWIIRRAGPEEKYLVLTRHREGHSCETAWIVVVIVAWEGVQAERADNLYDMLIHKLTKFGLQTERRCSLNVNRTCACQGVDSQRAGASFSFGCAWSMFFNSCKFARSKIVHKFRLTATNEQAEVEEKLQSLATNLAPVYKKLAPEAYRNQTEFEAKGLECRLGTNPGRPWTGVTACLDFCAHAHKDSHNMNNGCTVVVTLTRHRGFQKPDDEQLHVLPLYVMHNSDEFGSKEGQEAKVENGSMEVLSKYPTQSRLRNVPLESCRVRRKKRKDSTPMTASKGLIAKRMAFNSSCGQTLPKNRSYICKRKLFQDGPLRNHANISNVTNGKPRKPPLKEKGPTMKSAFGAGNPLHHTLSFNNAAAATSFPTTFPSSNVQYEQAATSSDFPPAVSNRNIGHQSVIAGEYQQRSQFSSISVDNSGGTYKSGLQLLSEAASVTCEQDAQRAAASCPFQSSQNAEPQLSGQSLQSSQRPSPPSWYLQNATSPMLRPYSQPMNNGTVQRSFESPIGLGPPERSQQDYRAREQVEERRYLMDDNRVFETKQKLMIHEPQTMEELRRECFNHYLASKTTAANNVPVAAPPPLLPPLPSFASTYMSFPSRQMNGFAHQNQSPFASSTFNPYENLHVPLTIPIPQTPPNYTWSKETSPSFFLPQPPQGSLVDFVSDMLHQMTSPPPQQPQLPLPSQPMPTIPNLIPDFNGFDPDDHHLPNGNGTMTPSDADEEEFYEVHSDNENNFHDNEIGGVAIALTHGSVLFECAKHELHATTALKNPNREHPARISLVFYQHKQLNYRHHGFYEYEQKLELKRQEDAKKVEKAAKKAGDVVQDEHTVAIEQAETDEKKEKQHPMDQYQQQQQQQEVIVQNPFAVNATSALPIQQMHPIRHLDNHYPATWMPTFAPPPLIVSDSYRK